MMYLAKIAISAIIMTILVHRWLSNSITTQITWVILGMYVKVIHITNKRIIIRSSFYIVIIIGLSFIITTGYIFNGQIHLYLYTLLLFGF